MTALARDSFLAGDENFNEEVRLARQALQGQVAPVTGGAGGIGRAMAEAMAMAGAKVWIASRNDSVINQTAAALRAVDLLVPGVRLDVTDRAPVEGVISSIAE